MVRGLVAQYGSYIGAPGQLIVDTSSWCIRVQDGVTPGGNPTMNAANNLSDLTNLATARSNLELDDFYDALGSATTAQSNAETFATNAVAVETARAEAAELVLTDGLAAEITRAEAAETAIGGAALQKANNLSDVSSAPTAAHNLGLGVTDNPTFASVLAGAFNSDQANSAYVTGQTLTLDNFVVDESFIGLLILNAGIFFANGEVGVWLITGIGTQQLVTPILANASYNITFDGAGHIQVTNQSGSPRTMYLNLLRLRG